MDKETLELEKLQAEIKEIHWRMKSEPSTLRLERFKVYPTYLAIAVSLVLGTLSYFHQRQQSLDQRAREQKFKISQEMISLVKELNTSESPALQRNAAIQLAFFRRPAIPILIENLDIAHKNIVYDAIIKGLHSIIVSEKNAAAVLTPLLQSADNVFQREMGEKPPNTRIIITHIRALGALAAITEQGSVTEQSRKTREKVKVALSDFERQVRRSNNEYLIAEKKKELLDLIELQIAKLET